MKPKIILISFTIILLIYLVNNNVLCSTSENENESNDESNECIPSETTASGSYAPTGPICSGDLIFEEDFNNFDLNLWHHEITLDGGYNGEFEWYVNNRSNSYTLNGQLHITPTFTADIYGEQFLTSGHLVLNPCTAAGDNGCEKTGNSRTIINPIQSARIKTQNSFQFKYGTVEVVARNPRGDWLWPAIWLLPAKNTYGVWPLSGEIDIMESRGNPNLWEGHTNIGVTQFATTLHWGPKIGGHSQDAWRHAHFEVENRNGFDNGLHTYKMDWSSTSMTFSVDGKVYGKTTPGEGGFWKLGGFGGNDNPWKNGGHMAPFDKEFYILLNMAVGGTSGYFPQTKGKPWNNNAPQTAARDFWNHRNEWMPSWEMGKNNNYEPTFIVESVKVWAM